MCARLPVQCGTMIHSHDTLMVKIEPGDTNIFNITQPDRYRCQIHHYHSRLSRLYLRVFKDQDRTAAFYLLFTDIAYMDCPVTWQGADFRIEAQDDCIALMLETGLVGQAILRFPDAYASLTHHARLYIATTAARPVRVIASSASFLRQLPSDL